MRRPAYSFVKQVKKDKSKQTYNSCSVGSTRNMSGGKLRISFELKFLQKKKKIIIKTFINFSVTNPGHSCTLGTIFNKHPKRMKTENTSKHHFNLLFLKYLSASFQGICFSRTYFYARLSDAYANTNKL